MLLSCISFRPNLPQVFLVATQEVTFRRFISQFAQSASIVSCGHIYHLFITVVASGAKFSPDLSHFSCSWSTSHLLASEGCQQLPCSSCSPIQSRCSPIQSSCSPIQSRCSPVQGSSLWGRCHKYRGGLWIRSHNISTLDGNKGSSFASSRWFVWKKFFESETSNNQHNSIWKVVWKILQISK